MSDRQSPVSGRGVRLAFGVVLVVALSSAAFWRWRFYGREHPLEPDWTAVVSVLAGDGVAGVRDGTTDSARFSDPFGVVAAADGTIYVADGGPSPRIRRIAPDRSVSTTAGGGRGYADGPGAAAAFNTPSGLAADAAGNIYVADTGNNAVRRIGPGGDVSTLAGDRFPGFRDGPPLQARFNGPIGIAFDASAQRIIVADTYNDRIRAIHRDGTVSTLAGAGLPGWLDGASDQARFDTPCGVAVDAAGNVYVADTGNGVVRVISAAGFVSTLSAPSADPPSRPIGIAATPEGVVFVADDRGRVVELTPQGGARILAGSRPGFAEGPGSQARFRGLAGIALAGQGRLIVTDPRNALVRLVVARSRVDLRLPPSPLIAPAFDIQAFAMQPLLWPVAPMEGPFEITGTLGELRGGEGTERFHSGLDIHAPEGTPVRVVRKGVVVSPVAAGEFGSLNESVRVGPLAYVHLRVGRDRHGNILDSTRFVPSYDDIGRLTYVRVRRGAVFETGDPIGTANAFNHVHLNVGWPAEELNPLHFRLVQFADTIRPTVARGGIRLFGEDGVQLTRKKKGRLIVGGVVSVVVDAWDQVNGNKRSRRLGLYELGYQVLHRDGSPTPGFDTPRTTIRFDRLAGGSDAARLVYASGSGIPFFGRRRTRFLYVVTNRLQDGIAAAGRWDTSELSPGDYTLRILAADVNGNQALTNRDVAITIVAEQLSALRH